MATNQFVNWRSKSVFSVRFVELSGSTYETKPLSNAVGRRPRMTRLYLAGVDLADNAPGSTIREAEGEDTDDDDPSGSALRVYYIRGVHDAHEKHEAGKNDAAIDSRGAPTPFVRKEQSRNGDGEHEYR